MSQPVPQSATAFWDLFTLFLFFGVLAGGTVVALMMYFISKYRYKEKQPAPKFEASPLRFRVREAIILASISGILLFSLATVSYRASYVIRYPPESDSLTINVTAFQWAFRFTYPNGLTVLGEARVPAETIVIFNVTSSDVFHDFGLPEFMLKTDAIPGVYNTLWITAPALGVQTELHYKIICYELCGVGHSFMTANLTVIDPMAFNQWFGASGMNMTGG